MNLADNWSDGNFLPEGEHLVTVVGHRMFTYTSQSQGVEFELRKRNGATGKIAFCLVETIQWRLAQFAKACGLTRDECRDYDPLRSQCHARLHNRQVIVVVEKGMPGKNGKQYNEVTDYRAVESEQPHQQAKPPAAKLQPTTATHELGPEWVDDPPVEEPPEPSEPAAATREDPLPW
mgnify:CR=1 FL=1